MAAPQRATCSEAFSNASPPSVQASFIEPLSAHLLSDAPWPSFPEEDHDKSSQHFLPIEAPGGEGSDYDPPPVGTILQHTARPAPA